MAYTPCYKARPSNSVGGMFITSDGTRRVIPDHYLNSARIKSNSTLLRLSYSTVVVDISGQRLDPIFYDVSTGKLGIVTVAGARNTGVQAVGNGPNVTGIVYTTMSPVAADDLESKDA